MTYRVTTESRKLKSYKMKYRGNTLVHSEPRYVRTERTIRRFKSGKEARAYANGLREGLGREGKYIHVRKGAVRRRR
jgi:hypothetical protein